MRTILRGAIGLLVAASVIPSAARAQAPTTNPVHFGILGGLTLPLGNFGDAADAGFHLGALADFRFAASPVGFRIDGQWHRNNIKNFDGHQDLIFGTANISVEPTQTPGSTIAPYVIGGVGLYHASFGGPDFNGADSETKAGFNVGGGLKFRLSGFDTFLEARYHYIATSGSSTSMLPISFGIVF